MNLSQEDIESFQKEFQEFDYQKEGVIKVKDLRHILDRLGINPPSQNHLYKLIGELDARKSGYIKFNDLLAIYSKYKMQVENDDDQDMIDAFVAMGGNEDGTGSVDGKKLIQIIKDEFQMSINIEKLIHEVDTDGSGAIEYDEFKFLLQTTRFH